MFAHVTRINDTLNRHEGVITEGADSVQEGKRRIRARSYVRAEYKNPFLLARRGEARRGKESGGTRADRARVRRRLLKEKAVKEKSRRREQLRPYGISPVALEFNTMRQ